MKLQRQNAIKDLLAKATAANGAAAITNQDELRRKLAARGIHVTQATLSRDIRELKLLKGPAGYELPVVDEEEEQLPEIGDVLQNFGLEVRQAQNLLIVLSCRFLNQRWITDLIGAAVRCMNGPSFAISSTC